MFIPHFGGHAWLAGGGWPWPWGLIMLVLWVALIVAVVWLVIRAARSRAPSGMDRAREILAERYARGEITTEEYRERLEQLR